MGLQRRSRRSDRSSSTPATAVLSAAIVAVYGVEVAAGVERFCLAHGLNPAHPTLATALASLFLHASVLHLVGNVAVLVAAGPIVEREVGSVKFTLLYVLAGLAGAALHMAVDANVLVGCSGSLAGLAAVLAVLRPGWCGAVAAFISWNIIMAWTGTVDGTSFAAHLGGFGAGAAFVMLCLCSCLGSSRSPSLRFCGVEAWR